MDKIVETRLDRKSIGFNAEIGDKRDKEIGALLKEVLPEDLTKFGLIPEFVGRVPINVSLEALDKEALVRILTEPRDAITKQYKKLFEFDEVKLGVEDEAALEIARLAFERKTGARGLRSIMEDVLMDVMYEIPSDDNIAECVLTKDVVEGKGKPRIVYRNRLLRAE